MAPRPAPCSGCPGRPALPCLSPQTENELHREHAVIERIFQALPTQTDTTQTIAALFVTTDR